MVVGRADWLLFHHLGRNLTSLSWHGIILTNKLIAFFGTLIQRGGGTGPEKPRQPFGSLQ
jgi:hypothetical protein